MRTFLLKKCEQHLHARFFFQQNIKVFGNKVVKHLTS